MLKRTPLFAAHQKLGGKLVEYGGWEMPVYYTSIMDEHQAVRRAAGPLRHLPHGRNHRQRQRRSLVPELRPDQ